MLTLTVPKPRWIAIPLANGEQVDLQITPPTHRQVVEALIAGSEPAGFVAARMSCVTNWKDVFDDANPPQPIPFTTEGFAALLRQHPEIVSALLDELRSLFQREIPPGK